MDERDLRGLLDQVKAGALSRRAFVRRMAVVGLAAPFANQLLALSGVAMAQSRPTYKPTKRGGGGLLEGAVVAGPDPAEPALRGRHQGPGRLAPVLRAARRLGRRGQPAADPGRIDPGPRGRHARRRRQVGDLEAEEGRQMARRPALHRRRRRLHLAVLARSGDGRGHQRLLSRRHGREGRFAYRHGEVPAADAVLGRRLRRRGRHGHSQAPVCRLHRRQVARGPDQPQAGRHRPVHVQGLQAGRPGVRRDQPELPRRESPALRRHRDEGRRRCGLGGACRAAVGRVRLRLEPAGRGRDPPEAGEGRQGPRHLQQGRRHRAHPAQQHRPVDRGRRRTLESRRPSIRS